MQSITALAEIKRTAKGEIEFKVVGRSSFLKMVGDYILENRESCQADVRIKRSSISKTNEQLRYYFGVVVHYALQGFRAAGFEFMDNRKTDIELRLMFFFDEYDTPSGKKRYVSSLEAASVVEVAELIDNCIMFCSIEFGIAIPEPDKNKIKI